MSSESSRRGVRQVAAPSRKTPCDEGGLTNPIQLVIACRCDGCAGELHGDGLNTLGTLGFLTCTVCKCAYTISAAQEPG